MAYYRLYFLNRRGHFAGVEEFEAADDLRAVAQVERDGSESKELWCSRRKIREWPLPGGVSR